MTITDALDAIDEIVVSYQWEEMSPERAMAYIAAVIADYESGEDV